MIRTRVILGSTETPKYVSKDFFDAMQLFCVTYQFDVILHPTTVCYSVAPHHVVERLTDWENTEDYEIELDDCKLIPTCLRRKPISTSIYKRKNYMRGFDRMTIYTENYSKFYYLLTPDAGYYNAEVYTEWNESRLTVDGITWKVHFKQVYVDPHNTSHTIWFVGKPKYKIELECNHDFTGREHALRRALYMLTPRDYRWA